MPKLSSVLDRRVMGYVLAGLVVYFLTVGAGGGVQVLVCAFAVGLATWQAWMRRFRLRWTGAMLIAVAVYFASWFQPFLVVLFVTWALVVAAIVAEAGRVMIERRARLMG